MVNQNFNLEFCDNYDYPKEIKRHLEFILKQIDEYLDLDNVISVILYGSTTRGELSYTVEDGELDIFSDYELEVITETKVSRNKIDKLKKSLARNAFGITNPLFHVDISINTKLSYWIKTKLDRRIAIFETRENGVILYGDNLLDMLSDINLKKLDFGNINELVLIRLWMQLLYLPEGFIRGDLGETESKVLKYFLARNALETLTIFLPHKGVLLPTYKSRVEYFVKNYANNSIFPERYSEFIEECYNVKKELRFGKSIEEYYKNMFEGYLALIEFLLGHERTPDNINKRIKKINDALYRGKKDFLNDNLLSKFRRKRREYKMWKDMLKNNSNTLQSIKWLFKDKRPYILGFLINMHRFLYNKFLSGENEDYSIISAKRFMEEFTAANPDSISDDWLELKNNFVIFMSRWLYNDPDYVKKLSTK